MGNNLENFGQGLLEGMKLGAVLAFSKLDDESVRKVFLNGIRYGVQRTKNHVSLKEQRRILGLLYEATRQVFDEIEGK